jgi:arylsulfatase A-like enzyme
MKVTNDSAPSSIRRPGVTANHTVSDIVLSIDVAPTFVAIATAAVPDDMDGPTQGPARQHGMGLPHAVTSAVKQSG